MKIAVNCKQIDTSRTLGVWRFGQRLARAIRNRGNEVIGLVPFEKMDSFNSVDVFNDIVPVHSKQLDTDAFDVELMLHHFQIPCARIPKAMIFHDLHLWDVPWKYENPSQMREGLKNIVRNIDAIMAHFPRTYYDLPKVMPEVSNRLFLTIFPTTIDYVEEDAELTLKTRAKYSISEHEKVLLYPSQLQPHKNHLNLFRAIKILKTFPIRLICTGSELQKSHAITLGEFISELGLEKRIVMTGNIDDHEMENMYHVADLIVSPSLAEGGAAIAQEAMAYGKNVICSDIRPVRLHLEKIHASIPLFNPLDPKKIAETISFALNMPQKNTKAKAIIDSWTWDKLAQQYDRVLNWLTAGKPSGEMPMFLDDSLGYVGQLSKRT